MSQNLSTKEGRKAKKLVIHLISDSAGQTVKYAARSAMKLFADIEAQYYSWPLIRSNNSMEEVLNKIKKKPGIILYTISNADLRNILKSFCLELKLPCVSVIGKIVKEISSYLGIGAENNFTSSYMLDENYFEKMDAIDYTIRHDDGQLISDLESADIILIGPSRTSKTPTSVYLAYNGFRTANIPYVYNHPFSNNIEKLEGPLIVGLVINHNILVEIRESRMDLLQVTNMTAYTDPNVVQQECLAIKKICLKKNWPIVDVSRRSIEETAAIIMKYYYEKKQSNHRLNK